MLVKFEDFYKVNSTCLNDDDCKLVHVTNSWNGYTFLNMMTFLNMKTFLTVNYGRRSNRKMYTIVIRFLCKSLRDNCLVSS